MPLLADEIEAKTSLAARLENEREVAAAQRSMMPKTARMARTGMLIAARQRPDFSLDPDSD